MIVKIVETHGKFRLTFFKEAQIFPHENCLGCTHTEKKINQGHVEHCQGGVELRKGSANPIEIPQKEMFVKER